MIFTQVNMIFQIIVLVTSWLREIIQVSCLDKHQYPSYRCSFNDVLKLWFMVLNLSHASHAHGATHMVDGDRAKVTGMMVHFCILNASQLSIYSQKTIL